jgi:hypothetical protein
VRLGIVSVSRDCFDVSLSKRRSEAVVGECFSRGIKLFEAETVVENETDMLRAVEK